MSVDRDKSLHNEEEAFSLTDRFHSGLTVEGLFMLWLASVQGKVSEATYHIYERTVRLHILPSLGKCEVDYLTEADITDFLKERLVSGRSDGKGGLSYKSVEDMSFVIRSALKLVEWDYSLYSSGHEFVQSQHAKREIKLLTMPQAETLTKYLMENLSRANAGYLLCLFTGIRTSEVCALKDADFRLEDDILSIRRTLQRVTMPESGVKRGATLTVDFDTGSSYYRDLTLPPQLSMLLWSLLRNGKEGSWFLTGSRHYSIGTKALSQRFDKLLKQTGLPDELTVHTLRHTFALLWLLRSNDLEGLSCALGHSSVLVTANRYAKVLEQAEAMLPSCADYLCTDVSSPRTQG